MKVSFQHNKVSFKRALTTQERIKGELAQQDARKLLDIDKVMIITPATSLPAGANDAGVGQLNSKTSMNFYKFMKSYTGINNVKLLPIGEMYPKNGFYCGYAGSALSLGTQNINLEELTTPEMGSILSKKTLKNVVQQNLSIQPNTLYANYENVVGQNTPHYKALKEAFQNFQVSANPKVAELKKEFEQYKIQNAENLESKALYEVLAKKNQNPIYENWVNRTEKFLYDTDVVPIKKRNEIIKNIKEKNAQSIEFTYFKQFLADKNLAKAKNELNSNGLKLFGDCLIGYSKDEMWSHPKAFEKEAKIGSASWSLKSLDFSKILDENSESYKLLKQKVSYFAKRFDALRFDVGWAYEQPLLYTKKPELLKDRYVFDTEKNAYVLKNPLNGQLITKIENIVKEVKGSDYDTKNLIYEIEAGPKEFSPFDWNKNVVKDGFKNRTIVQSTCYLSNDYANINMLENRMKVPRDNYFYMVGNHDHIVLNALANGQDTKKILAVNKNNIHHMLEKQYKALSDELKIDENIIKSSPEEFVKAKFGQIFKAKNIKMFFMDIFGFKEQYDSQTCNTAENYRNRVPANYEEAFHKAVQEKRGFNVYDALSKAMKAKGLDEKNKGLYDELVKFANILEQKGALTEAEANNPLGANIKTSLQKNKIIALTATALIALIAGITLYNKKHEHPQLQK